MNDVSKNGPERLYTIKDAASHFGVPYFKMQRAVKRGIIPGYRFFNSRMLVRLSDIEKAVRRVNSGD